MDVQSIARVLMEQFQARIADQTFSFEAASRVGIDDEEIDRLLADLPSDPDDHLR